QAFSRLEATGERQSKAVERRRGELTRGADVRPEPTVDTEFLVHEDHAVLRLGKAETLCRGRQSTSRENASAVVVREGEERVRFIARHHVARLDESQRAYREQTRGEGGIAPL